jgi:hypothetical protein
MRHPHTPDPALRGDAGLSQAGEHDSWIEHWLVAAALACGLIYVGLAQADVAPTRDDGPRHAKATGTQQAAAPAPARR